jgi:methionyl-tRNA formyltransferase
MTEGVLAARRVLFWGGKQLGYRCLAHLVEHARNTAAVEIVGVGVSARDGRRGGADRTAVASLARRLGLPTFTECDDVTVSADVGIAIGYPHLIPPSALDRCRDGALNLHLAPLPHYRGTKTLVHAILNGDSRHGATLHYMDAGIDTGDVVVVRWMDLPRGGTTQQIMVKLADLGYEIFVEYLPRILAPGRLPAVPQSDLVAAGVAPMYCTRRSIDPLYRLSAEWDFDTLHRHTRALTTGDARMPYLEQDGRRIYLSVDPPGPPDDDTAALRT